MFIYYLYLYTILGENMGVGVSFCIYLNDEEYEKFKNRKKEIRDEVKNLVKAKLNGPDNLQAEDELGKET